jgi:hypothetical protein
MDVPFVGIWIPVASATWLGLNELIFSIDVGAELG